MCEEFFILRGLILTQLSSGLMAKILSVSNEGEGPLDPVYQILFHYTKCLKVCGHELDCPVV